MNYVVSASLYLLVVTHALHGWTFSANFGALYIVQWAPFQFLIFQFFVGWRSICGITDYPILDFVWQSPWVLKPGWFYCLCALNLKVTSGATLAFSSNRTVHGKHMCIRQTCLLDIPRVDRGRQAEIWTRAAGTVDQWTCLKPTLGFTLPAFVFAIVFAMSQTPKWVLYPISNGVANAIANASAPCE